MMSPRAFLLVTLALALTAAAPAGAATITVTAGTAGTADTADSSNGSGTCDTGTVAPNGICTLRAAIQTANFDTVPDTILLPAGIYTRTVAGNNENAAAQGDLDVTTPVTIQGNGAASTTINANNIDRVFDVLGANANLQLSGVTVTGGNANSFLGAGLQIASGTTVGLTGVTVTQNATDGSTSGGLGGGIYNLGNLTVTDSEITANNASGTYINAGFGGGIYNAGALSLNRVLVSANGASKNGAGLLQASSSPVSIASSTFAGNEASTGGGAIATGGSSTPYPGDITYSTITGNASGSGAGGISRSDLNGVWKIESSIVALNTSGNGATQCTGGPFTSVGHNIVGDASCGTAAAGDKQNTDPALGPLQDNGGPTNTRMPNPGSPAIDAGASTCPLVDQRGVSRPLGSACDIGAVETPGPIPPAAPQPTPNQVVLDPTSATRTPGDANVVTATVTRTDGSVAANIELRYLIVGANDGSGLVVTDAAGKAKIAWDGVHDGSDNLTAYLDLNGNATLDPSDHTATATVNWVLPVPQVGKTVNLEPVSGQVFVKLPAGSNGKSDPGAHAAASYIKLEEAKSVPMGTIVDARRGRVDLTSAVKKGSSATQTGQFYSGAFQMTQENTTRPYTELRMTEQLVCPKSGSKVTAARAKTRKLWGKDSKGRFRTRGRNSTATVRGTTWYTKDTCTTTTTVVREGSVVVRDFAKNKNVTVKAGKRYVARAKKTKSKR